MADPAFENALAALCRRLFGDDAPVVHLRRLTGGANMESWSFDRGERGLVLRRIPAGGQRIGEDVRISVESEAALIALAGRHGVAAPPILGVLEPADRLGEGYVMGRVEGQTLPHKILGNPEFATAEAVLAAECAAELAKVHGVPIGDVPDDIPREDTATMLAGLKDRCATFGAEFPVFDFAFRWLEEHLPDDAPPRLLHGDFRMGNLMIGPEGLIAILDWELAHIGDPVQDLAYLCTPSWRFTRHDRPVGGFAEIDDLLDAYETASGKPVERERFDWWLVYSTLWWGVACLNMANIWRTGRDRSLERAVIGRRVSEVEVDLLLLFDPMLGDDPEARIAWELPAEPEARGETGNAELLDALTEWDEHDVIPDAAGRDLFQARVARNALGIARRGAAMGATFAWRRAERLSALGLDHAALRSGLAGGSLSPADPALRNHLRMSALERLAIDQPKYPAFKAALAAWSRE